VRTRCRSLVSGQIRAGVDTVANEPHVPEELLELPIGPDAAPRQRHAPAREAMTRTAAEMYSRSSAATALDAA
jgi:hypothetical protein